MNTQTHNTAGPFNAPTGLIEDTELSIHLRTTVAVMAMLGVLAAALLSGVGVITTLEASTIGSRGAMLLWGCLAIFLPLLPVGASGAAFASLSRVSGRLRLYAHIALALAALAMVGLAFQGSAWHAEAHRVGGNWKGLDMFVATLLGVMLPGLVAVLCAGQCLALLGVRRLGNA